MWIGEKRDNYYPALAVREFDIEGYRQKEKAFVERDKKMKVSEILTPPEGMEFVVETVTTSKGTQHNWVLV